LLLFFFCRPSIFLLEGT